MKLYGVVNMDIVGSRLVRDRRKLQASLSSYIDRVNEKYRDILACPVALTLGDEWQLITSKPSETYNLIHEFQQLLWLDELELYAGIGIGELSTPIAEDIRRMDGSCFHTARYAINIAKSVKRLKNSYDINKLNRVFLVTNQVSAVNFDFSLLNYYYSSKAMRSETTQEIAVTREDSGSQESETVREDTDSQKISVVREDAALQKSEGAQDFATIQEIVAAAGKCEEAGLTDVKDKLLLERVVNLIIENNEVLKAKMTKKQREIYISYSKLGSYRKVVELKSEDSRESIGGISQKLNHASYFTIQRNHNMVSALLNTYCTGE